MSAEFRTVCIHRIHARMMNHVNLDYPEARQDLKQVFAELERVRADNAHLRALHAKLWDLANAPRWRPWALKAVLALALIVFAVETVIMVMTARGIGR